MLIDGVIPVDRIVIKKLINVPEKILEYKDLTIEFQSMWNVKNKSDTGNKKGDWNHLKITQTIPELHNRKVRNQGTTKNSHIEHCTQTAGSADVKVQNILHGRNNTTCSTDCTYRTAATLYTLETGPVSGT